MAFLYIPKTVRNKNRPSQTSRKVRLRWDVPRCDSSGFHLQCLSVCQLQRTIRLCLFGWSDGFLAASKWETPPKFFGSSKISPFSFGKMTGNPLVIPAEISSYCPHFTFTIFTPAATLRSKRSRPAAHRLKMVDSRSRWLCFSLPPAAIGSWLQLAASPSALRQVFSHGSSHTKDQTFWNVELRCEADFHFMCFSFQEPTPRSTYAKFSVDAASSQVEYGGAVVFARAHGMTQLTTTLCRTFRSPAGQVFEISGLSSSVLRDVRMGFEWVEAKFRPFLNE